MSKILVFLTLFGSINTVLMGACTTEQGAYSGGYQAGIEQKGNCNGVVQAYSGAKMIAPKQFKTSTDTVYALCVQGARDGYDGKKTAKLYKKECIDYPIAKVK